MSPVNETVTQFERNARVVLERSVSRIDARTRSRLNQARQAALAAAGARQRPFWLRGVALMPATGAAAAALLLAVVLWHREPAAGIEVPMPEGQRSSVEDMDLLADSDALDPEGWTACRRVGGSPDRCQWRERQLMWKCRTGLAVLMLALGCVAARGDEARKAPDDPDAGFLEFLGSVDRLAEVNPDYLSQADPTKAARPRQPCLRRRRRARRRRTPRRLNRCRRVHRTHPEDTTMNNRWRSLALAVLLSVAAAAAAPSMAQEAPPAPAASLRRPWRGRASRPISRGCCRFTASGTRCRRRGSGGCARQRALARHVGRAARPGARAFYALALTAARATPGAAQPLAEVPGAVAGREGQRAPEFPPLSAAAARAAPDAARAVAQRHPRTASADDRARARAAHEACRGAAWPATASPAPLNRQRGRNSPHPEIAAALKCVAVGYLVPPLRGRTGMGTLQTSTWPAGTLNHSS